jgi:hypothetical protein
MKLTTEPLFKAFSRFDICEIIKKREAYGIKKNE